MMFSPIPRQERRKRTPKLDDPPPPERRLCEDGIRAPEGSALRTLPPPPPPPPPPEDNAAAEESLLSVWGIPAQPFAIMSTGAGAGIGLLLLLVGWVLLLLFPTLASKARSDGCREMRRPSILSKKPRVRPAGMAWLLPLPLRVGTSLRVAVASKLPRLCVFGVCEERMNGWMDGWMGD